MPEFGVGLRITVTCSDVDLARDQEYDFLSRRGPQPLELQVSAGNSEFGGAIAVQVLDSELQEAAWSLEGFPNAPSDERRIAWGRRAGVKGSPGDVEMHFFCLDQSGHSVARVRLTEATGGGSGQFVELVVSAQAAHVDRFVAALAEMAKARTGVASL